jgi:hypothetical protein
MCGPLGVSHLLLFSRSEAGNTNLRLARTPRGPTLHFRVEKYSLCKDIFKSQKHPRAGATDFHVAPLLVMNNFITSDEQRERLGDGAPPKHLEKLVTDMFQGLSRTQLLKVYIILIILQPSRTISTHPTAHHTPANHKASTPIEQGTTLRR